MTLSTEMQFSTDLALMNIKPQRIKVDDVTRTNDNRVISRQVSGETFEPSQFN